jgi:Skp family chaperone for outer membrane proteins
VIQIASDAARSIVAGFAVTLSLVLIPATAFAQSQSGQGWFIPNQQKQGATQAQAPQKGQPAAVPTAPQPSDVTPEPVQPLVGQPGQLPPLRAQLPPMPEIPSIPKGPPTPAAIFGVLSVPDVLRVATAYQAVVKELSERDGRYKADQQKEKNARDALGRSLANERGTLQPEQIRTREKEIQQREMDDRLKDSDRARIIQEAYQYAMAQIERAIEQVTQQVAAARGVNIVLSKTQVLGTTPDFDLTPQVADVLNKILPTVVVPPEGVSTSTFTPPVAGPRVSANPSATPPAKN